MGKRVTDPLDFAAISLGTRVMSMQQLYLLVALAPLAGAIIVGLWGSKLGRTASHSLCILGVAARSSVRATC